MKIKEITLRNFKRFTELKITGLAESVKLVVLLGPNGCGKSSVFDAIYGYARRHYVGSDLINYYSKKTRAEMDFDFHKNVKVAFHGNSPESVEQYWKSVYVRTAHRNVPSFQIQKLGKVPSAIEENRVARLIDQDSATENNYLRLVSRALQYAFEDGNPKSTLEQFRHEIIGEIATNILNMFPDLSLNSLGNPLAGASTFRFDKGTSAKFLYENLSGGEKAAFDLILDLVVKKQDFNDTVYCIDEPEAHMSTRLQKNLLACLYGLIPDNCQLWIATHSIGMVRKTQEIQRENPDAVAFLDFDGKNFDEPEDIKPVIPTRQFWQNAYKIALDDLAVLVVPKQIIICEGKPGKDGFDAQCYNKIFGDEFPDTLFVSAKGKGDVANLAPVMEAIAQGSVVIPLIDRDQKNGADIEKAEKQSQRVLGRCALENYLLDDEILRRFCEKQKCPEKADDLIKARDEAIGNLQCAEAKQAAQAVWQKAKDILKMGQIGETWQTFLSGCLAPLVTPNTDIYKELETDIFGNDTK